MLKKMTNIDVNTMTEVVSDFLNRFNHLEGITIGDRKKSLALLLRDYNSLNEDVSALDHILQNLRATTYLQQKFVVNILIHFRRYTDLLRVFTEENEVLMKPIWKQVWFFEKLLHENNSDFIVDNLFEHLSYVTRLRFLRNINRFIKDETKVENLYNSILHKYGVICANELLTGCSLKKILEIIKEHKTRLSNKQIIFLHKFKKNSLIELIQSEYFGQLFDFYDVNSKALTIIAGSDFEFFFNIFKNNRCSNIGKQLTKRLLNVEKQYVLSKPADLYHILHKRTLVKRLRSDFKQFFWDTWPCSFKNFSLYSCFALMRFYPKSKHFELIQEGLQKVYGESISNHPDLIDDKFLKYNENVEVRESLLEIKIKHCKDEYTLPQYYSIGKSIPILKKKISAADGVTKRENLIKALVYTCEVNNDLDALLEVQKYFSFRHRNDDQSIKSSFLHEIKKCFDMTKLSENHWKLIFEVIEWGKTKNENLCENGKIYVLYIKFLYRNNKPLDAISNVLLTHITDINDFGNIWGLLKDLPKLEYFILLNFINHFPTLPLNDDAKSKFAFELFEAIIDWNKRHPEDHIHFWEYSFIKESIKTKLKKPSYRFSSYLNNLIQGKIICGDEVFFKEIESLFWQNFSTNFSTNIVEYYLRKKPLNILEQFSSFISVILGKYTCDSLSIWRLLKHYDHISLPQKTIEYIIQNKTDYITCLSGMPLASLMQSDDYIKMIPNINTKIDIENHEECSQYRAANSLLPFTKYLNSNSVLPVVVEFCKGDLLHTCLPPLYYYFFHTAEKHLLEHLNTLSNRSVSVRKHAVKLACSVMPVEIIYNLIKQMVDIEKNNSVIEHLFHKTFKYFLKQPSDQFWHLIQLQLKSLDIQESNTFKDACSLKRIPKKYEMMYLKFIWELLDEIQEQGHDITDLKDKLIASLNPDIIESLDYLFCSDIIKKKFLRFGSKSEKLINTFVLNCLKYGKQKQQICEDIFGVISEFKVNYILHPEFNISIKSYSYISSFIRSLYSDFLDEDNLDHDLVLLFHTHWMRVFTPRENINDYILLLLLLELKPIKDSNSYVIKIAELFNELIREYGIVGIIDCFTDALSYNLPDYLSDNYEEKKYQLALKLIDLQNNIPTNLLAINLLPQEIPENDKCKTVFFNILEKLGRLEDNVMKINLDLFIRSLSH